MRSRYAECAARKSTERVSAELFACRARKLPGDRRLGDDCEGFDGLHVAALDERLAGLAGLEVYGAKRAHQGRQRLHGRPYEHRLAVRDPAFYAACPIGRATAIADRSRRAPRIPGGERAQTRRRSRHPSPPGSPSPPRRAAHPASSPSRRRSRGRVERLRPPPRRRRRGCRGLHERRRSPAAIPPRSPCRRSRGHEPATSTPISSSNAFATAPAATCTAVCLALARSSVSRVSSWPYLSVPARSA